MSSVLQCFLLQALCPLRDVPSISNHGDPLSYYQTGDIIRGDQFPHISEKSNCGYVYVSLHCFANQLNFLIF